MKAGKTFQPGTLILRTLLWGLLLSLLLGGCEETAITPKPRGYPRIIYPEKSYQPFRESYCDFTFEYPTYAVIEQDTNFFDEKPAHPCWFDIYVPAFEARIHCSYLPIEAGTPIDKLKHDAFKITDWHNKKATYIEEIPFRKNNDVKGVLFKVEGPVASPYQFFLTDSLERRHFLRGALYFRTQARPDSLAPLYEFLKKDIDRLLETFEWTD